MRPKKILLTPQGSRFSQSVAGCWAAEPYLMLICGHYEGFDERIRMGLDVDGDFASAIMSFPAARYPRWW